MSLILVSFNVFKGFFSLHDCVYGVQFNMFSCFFFLKKKKHLFFINFTFIECRIYDITL